MHLRAKPPVLVPVERRAEIEQLTKATLMDLSWYMAEMLAREYGEDDMYEVFCRMRNHVVEQRKDKR